MAAENKDKENGAKVGEDLKEKKMHFAFFGSMDMFSATKAQFVTFGPGVKITAHKGTQSTTWEYVLVCMPELQRQFFMNEYLYQKLIQDWDRILKKGGMIFLEKSSMRLPKPRAIMHIYKYFEFGTEMLHFAVVKKE
jgi:hypothetical protein